MFFTSPSPSFSLSLSCFFLLLFAVVIFVALVCRYRLQLERIKIERNKNKKQYLMLLLTMLFYVYKKPIFIISSVFLCVQVISVRSANGHECINVLDINFPKKKIYTFVLPYVGSILCTNIYTHIFNRYPLRYLFCQCHNKCTYHIYILSGVSFKKK